MTLYEIDGAMQALIDPETGELVDCEAFSALQLDRDIKLENTALWIKDLEAEATAIKNEETALKERRQAAEAKIVRLKEFLSFALNGQKFSTARCVVSFRRTKFVDVSDADAVERWAARNNASDCVRIKSEINKTAVRAAIESGLEVDGAQIVEKTSVGVK